MTEKITEWGLRYPFRLEGVAELSTDQATVISNGLRFSLKVGSPWNTVTVEGFGDEGSAQEFVTSMWGGLAAKLLKQTLPFDAPLTTGKVVYFDEPTSDFQGLKCEPPAYSIADGSDAYIFSIDKRILNITAGSVTGIMKYGTCEFLCQLAEYATSGKVEPLATNERLRTAVELYSASFIETSERTKLITLVMAIVELTSTRKKHRSALALLDKWGVELEYLLSQTSESDNKWISYDALQRELIFRKELSIRGRVREMVRSLLPNDKQAELDVISAYDARGKLVHGGENDRKELSDATNNLRKITPRLIEAELLRVVALEAGH